MGVVVLAHGPEPDLEACLAAVRASVGVTVELVLVDNGCQHTDLPDLARRFDAVLLRPARNLGFAGGCNLAVASLSSDVPIALVNSDAVVERTALGTLLAALDETVGIATASVRWGPKPDLMNSAGNPVHYTGVTWAGGHGELAGRHAAPRDVASASGAAMVVRRDAWDQLQGFWDVYFTYLEDTELSLRCWLAGWRVAYVPGAEVWHHYEFHRSPLKQYYLERNRLLMILTVYEGRTLLALGPMIVCWELVVLLGALVQGWASAKVRGWLWVLTHAQAVRARRRVVQQARRRPDDVLMRLLEDRISATSVPLPRGFGAVNACLAAYWRVVGRWVLGPRRGTDPVTQTGSA